MLNYTLFDLGNGCGETINEKKIEEIIKRYNCFLQRSFGQSCKDKMDKVAK